MLCPCVSKISWSHMTSNVLLWSIWQESIWPILVSKEPPGPQLIRFRQINCLNCLNFFPLIQFGNPFYILTKQEVEFGTDRNLIVFVKPNRIFFWLGICFKLIHFRDTLLCNSFLIGVWEKSAVLSVEIISPLYIYLSPPPYHS